MADKNRVKRARERAVMLRRIDTGTMLGIMVLGEIVAQRAQARAPVKSGRLARSIHRGPPERVAPFVWSVRIGTNVEYARAQEMGSGLYAEDPQFRKKIKIIAGAYNPDTKSKTPKKALSFKWPGGPDPHPALQTEGPYAGRYVFHSVMHPGVRPQPYLRPALASVREDGTHSRVIFGAIQAEISR